MSLKLNDLNVLYIDDILGYTEGVESRLQETFHEVFHTESFIDHVKLFKEIFIDLIIVNIDSESFGGIKFINLIKKNSPDFPMIALSSLEDKTKLDEKIFSLEITHAVQKPVATDILIQTIRSMESVIVDFAMSREKRNVKTLDRSLDADEALATYFKSVVAELMKYDRDIPTEKKMDFSIMKSFLFTAFNNLKALDMNILDDNLKIAKKKLDMAISMKDKMDKKTASSIEENYEIIFLMKQVPYVKAMNELEEVKEKIYKLLSEHKVYEKKIDAVKKELQGKTAKSPNYDKLKESLNAMSKANVDIIHEVRDLKDKSETIHEKMDEYRENHFENFKTAYIAYVDGIKTEITDTLNVLAYRFDKELWRSAKKSKAVHKFFYEARIEGLYSSKTYMKYYTGKLDIKKAGEQTAKLIRYIEQYNKKNPINIAVLGEEMDMVQRAKEAIEKIDSSIKVIGFLDPKKLIEGYKTYGFTLVLLDLVTEGTSAGSVIKTLQKAYPKEIKDAVFCINVPSGKLMAAENAVKGLEVPIHFNDSRSASELQNKIMKIL